MPFLLVHIVVIALITYIPALTLTLIEELEKPGGGTCPS